jgi:Zn-dependent peptidase ImmA (M78 family)/transcriptional regulator with XRE-family HTH domain
MVKLLYKGVVIMNVSLVIGNNIKELMDKEKLSLRKLSESIGVSHPTLKKYIDGNQPIDSEKLMKVALYFQKPFDYFFKEKHENVCFLFRADKPEKDIKNIDIDKLKNAIYSYIDIIGDSSYQYIPQKYSINISDDKKNVFNLISKIAIEQRRVANIENVIPENYFEVINNIGVNVIVRDFKNDNYFGASSFSKEFGSYIIINDSENIPEERKIFSLIHEYAHLLFHSEQYTDNEYNAFYVSGKYDLNEKIANKFAGYFLMPRNLVDMYIESKKHIDPIEMKKYFKVSIQTLYVMLYEYKVISKEIYTNFWKQINSAGYKTKEPHPLEKIDIQDKNNKLINKIKDLYFKEEISANKISEVLGTNTIDTRRLLKEWRNIDERYLSLG